jgi:hypothetical protein
MVKNRVSDTLDFSLRIGQRLIHPRPSQALSHPFGHREVLSVGQLLNGLYFYFVQHNLESFTHGGSMKHYT